MIYILSNSDSYSRDIDDIVVMASTKIDDILESLYKTVPIASYCRYTVLIVAENDDCFAYTFTPRVCSYDSFEKYPPQFLLNEENIEEYRHIKDQLRIWCDAVKEKEKKEKEERERILADKKEEQERKLYETLKAKYGD